MTDGPTGIPSETVGILSKPFVKGEGKTIINFISERLILLNVMAIAVGDILIAAWPEVGVLAMLAVASAAIMSGVIAFRGHVGSL